MTTYIVSALVVGLAAAAPVALAQDTNTSARPERPVKERPVQPNGYPMPGRAQSAQVRPTVAPEGRANMLETNREWRDTILNAAPEERAELIRANLDDRRAKMAEVRADFKERLLDRKEAFKERVGERATNRYEHIMALLEAMVARLTGIADRIDARIDALAADGADTSDAEAELREARDLIDTAETKIDDLSAAVADALASDNPREALQDVRPVAQEAKQALRAAHEALREAAAALPRPERSQDDS